MDLPQPLPPPPPAIVEQAADNSKAESLRVLNELLSLDCITVTRTRFPEPGFTEPAYCIKVHTNQPITMRNDLLKIVVSTGNLDGEDSPAYASALAQSVSTFIQRAGLDKRHAANPILNMIRIQTNGNAEIRALLDSHIKQSKPKVRDNGQSIIRTTETRLKSQPKVIKKGQPSINTSETILRKILDERVREESNSILHSPTRTAWTPEKTDGQCGATKFKAFLNGHVDKKLNGHADDKAEPKNLFTRFWHRYSEFCAPGRGP